MPLALVLRPASERRAKLYRELVSGSELHPAPPPEGEGEGEGDDVDDNGDGESERAVHTMARERPCASRFVSTRLQLSF